MNLFFDTSSLLKHYIQENGSDKIDSLFLDSKSIFVSEITIVESFSALNRLLREKIITKQECSIIYKEVEYDHQYFTVISIKDSLQQSIESISKYHLKTLDGIQLGSALTVKEQIDKFVCNDEKLIKAARKENLGIFVG